MNEDLEDYLNRLIEVRVGLTEIVQEARGLMKDLNKAVREYREVIPDEIQKHAETTISKVIDEELQQVVKATHTYIDSAEKNIYKRFDTLTKELLDTKRNPTIPELLAAKAYVDNLIYEKSKIAGLIRMESLPGAARKKKKKR